MILNHHMINRKFLSILAIAAGSTLAISGCQSTATTMQPTHHVTPVVVTAHPTTMAGKSALSCMGIYGCEINSIGKTAVINSVTHQPSPALAQNNHVTITPLAKSTPLAKNPQQAQTLPNYLVSFPSGQQFVGVRFYLDNHLKSAESFSFVQNFDSGKHYALKAYRQIQQTDYSLLAQSAPTPLCVDLYEDNKLTNKWCKKPNQQGALSNEFIKVLLPSK